MSVLLRRHVLADAICITAVVSAMFLPYVRSLGFYSDDWDFLATFYLSGDQSLSGLVRRAFSEWPSARVRPVHFVYMSGMYRLFGMDPLGYHLVNGAVFVAIGLGLYAVFRDLEQPRVVALAVPVVYLTLPHYSTTRLWIAAFQVSLSVALYVASLYATLRCLRAQARVVWGWRLIAVASLVCSVLSYEITAPLFVFNIAVAWRRSGAALSTASGRSLAWTGAVTLVALAIVTGHKAMLTDRAGFHEPVIDYLKRLVLGSIGVNWIEYGLLLPRAVWRALRYYPDPVLVVTGAVLAIATFAYLFLITVRSTNEWPSTGTWLRWIAVGILVFALGYGVFLATSQVAFTTTGINNRTGMAAAGGVAIAGVGLCGLLASAQLWSERSRSVVFCGLVAVSAYAGFVIHGRIASSWISAYEQQKAVLAEIQENIPQLSNGTVFILDGVCPYVGPGVVFEAPWDLTGALRIRYGDPTLKADVVTPRMYVRADGLVARIYGEESLYPFGEGLMLYNFTQRTMYRLTDREAARRYFQTVKKDYTGGCPAGRPGYGVPIF